MVNNMKATHWLLLDNLMKGYPCSTGLLGIMVKESLDWTLQNGFIDEDTCEITEKGKGYFLLHQHDPLDNE